MMRASRIAFVSLLALAAAAWVGPSSSAQTTVPDACPRPGYVTGTIVVPEDRNDNGVVCVNPETGDVSDDVDPPSEQHKDANQDLIVCYNQDKGVITDDRIDGSSDVCPPGFIPFLVIVFE